MRKCGALSCNMYTMKTIILTLLAIFLSSISLANEPARANLHYKKIKMIMNADYKQGYRDNVYLASASPQADYASNVKGMGGISIPILMTQTDICYFFNHAYNAEHQAFNVKSHSLSVIEKVIVGRFLVLFVDGSLTRGKSYSLPGELAPVDMLSTRGQFGGGLKTKYRLSFTYKLGVVNEYDYNGGMHRIFTTDDAVYFEFTPKTSILLRYISDRQKEISDDVLQRDDTRTHAGRIGVRFAKILRRLSGQVEFGTKYAKGELHGTPENDTADAGINLGFSQYPMFFDAVGKLQAPFAKVTMGLDLQVGIRPTFGTNRIYAFAEQDPDITQNLVYKSNPFVSVLGSKLMVSWKPLPRLTFGAAILGETRTFPVGSRYDRLATLSGSATWSLAKYWQLSLEGGRSMNWSNIDAYEYTLNEIGARISVRL